MPRKRTRPIDEIARLLGTNQPLGTRTFVLFLPSVDKFGKPIDHEFWVTEALNTFGQLFRGATAYPRARGVWRDDERGGDLVLEEPTIVTCYADPNAATDAALAQLRQFLHRLGRETQQGEVGIVIDDAYCGITKYDDQ